MNKLWNHISVKIYIFFAISILGAAVCYFLTSRIVDSARATFLEGTYSNFRDYGSLISNQMEITGYLNSPNSNVDNELNTIAELYGGRVVVTNAYHVIVYDSYQTETGKTLVSKNIVACLSGKELYEINEESEHAKILLPLQPTGADTVSGALIVQVSISDELRNFKTFRERAIAYGMIAWLVVLLAAGLAAMWIAYPIRRIMQAMKHIASGFLNEEVHVDGNREAASISRSTNEMLWKNKQLEKSRQEFVSNVSHELKTPMTSMKVLSESLLVQPDTPVEMYREFLTDINDEITRENEIITDLLTLVSLDRSAAVLKPVRTNMNALLETILKRVRPLAEQRGIEVVLESYREVFAKVDEVRLMMALTNIVENAVKYNREFGYVHVTLNADLRFVYITIEDAGIGIPEEEIPHIFERFYRVDKTRSRETGGNGLGLAIAQEIIQMHQGTIRVSSKEKEGTTFTIRIPLNVQVL